MPLVDIAATDIDQLFGLTCSLSLSYSHLILAKLTRSDCD